MRVDYNALLKLIKKYHKDFSYFNGHYEVTSKDFHSTFSFLNYIFWKDDPELSEIDREKIRKHELIHVKQKHSYDVIYIKVLCALLWFNPIIWLYRNALDNTHEYLADNSVINTTDKYSYIKLLVNELFRDSGLNTVHHFAKSRTTRRIEMMKLKSYVTDKGRFLLVIPVSLVLLVVFSFEVRQVDIAELYPEEQDSGKKLDITISKYEGESKNSILIESNHIEAQIEDLQIEIDNIDSRLKTEKAIELINQLNLELTQSENDKELEVLPSFPGGDPAWNQFLIKNLNYPESAVKDKAEGDVFVEFIVRKDGRIENVNLVKGFHRGCDKESIRLMESSPPWVPGKVDGVERDIKIIVPIPFRIS